MRQTCVMPLQDASHYILVQFDAERMRKLLSDCKIAEFGISAFHLQHGSSKACRWALRPRLCPALAGVEQSVLAPDQSLVEPHKARRSQNNRNPHSPIRRQPKRTQTEKQTIPNSAILKSLSSFRMRSASNWT